MICLQMISKSNKFTCIKFQNAFICKHGKKSRWRNLQITKNPPPKKKQQINQQSYEKKKKYKMPNFRTLKPDAKNDQCVMKKKWKNNIYVTHTYKLLHLLHAYMLSWCKI